MHLTAMLQVDLSSDDIRYCPSMQLERGKMSFKKRYLAFSVRFNGDGSRKSKKKSSKILKIWLSQGLSAQRISVFGLTK